MEKQTYKKRQENPEKEKVWEDISCGNIAVADIELERFTSNFLLKEQRNRMESPEIDLST